MARGTDARAGGSTRPVRRSLLLVPYDDKSFSPLQIAEAAESLADICWVIDGSATLGPLGAVLGRLGRVVDRSGRDLDDLVAELGESRADGIVTFSHDELLLSAALAARLALPYNTPAATARGVDKWSQRSALAAAGVPIPLVQTMEVGPWPRSGSAASLGLDRERLVFPAVLKPRSGAGSADTHLIADESELTELVEHPGALPPGRYVLEEYLVGSRALSGAPIADYVSVESVLVSGVRTHIEITGKFPLVPAFRETGNFQPSALSPSDATAVTDLADAAIGALGLTDGVVHTEIKLTDAGPRVIEVNPRAAGGGIAELVEARHGISLMRLAVLAALGEKPALGPVVGPEVVYDLFIQPPAGATCLRALSGIDDAARLPGVERIAQSRPIGGPVNWHEGSLGYIAAVRGRAADHAELVARRATILETIRPVYEGADGADASASFTSAFE